VIEMITRNAFIALISAVFGGLLVAFVIGPGGPASSAKSDRLSGPTTETAFLPERFGVPGSAQ
jgi:hypothetical protein